ncbi:hypothetical protein L6164_035626 [Bauhinia variegata]|nr:hypothetical protein L6164_035626 [Bauhinia variegata]
MVNGTLKTAVLDQNGLFESIGFFLLSTVFCSLKLIPGLGKTQLEMSTNAKEYLDFFKIFLVKKGSEKMER